MSLRLGLIFSSLCCIGCPADPEPSPTDDGTTTATSEPSEDTIATTSAATSATTGSSLEDCDAIDDPTACESLVGSDFECVWMPNVYAVELDGSTCSIGEAAGRCVAVVDVGDTSCYEEDDYQCTDGSSLDLAPYLELEEGLFLLAEGTAFQNILGACNSTPQWQFCNGMGGPAVCECACDPGLPQ